MILPARTIIRLISVLAVFGALTLASSCTIVKHDATSAAGEALQKAASNEEFDAKAYVKANWESRIEPELLRNAVDIRELVEALKKNQDAAERKFGRRKDETALFNFIVKGDEVIASVDTESAAGYIELGLADTTGQGKVRVQIGPVIKSSAVRDVLPFVNFGDFVNQLDFANISREINFYVRDNIVAGLKKTDIVSKRVTFVGAFSEDSTGEILITPVRIEIAK